MINEFIRDMEKHGDLHGILNHIVQFGANTQSEKATDLHQEYNQAIEDFHAAIHGTTEVARIKRQLMEKALQIVFDED